MKRKKRKKLWLRVLLLCMAGIIGASSYFIYQVWGAVDQSYDPLNRQKSEMRQEEVTMKDPFTVMFVGTDVRNADTQNWRADVIMIAAVNPEKKSIELLSIPRDTLTEIQNSNGVKTKINAAPYYGIQSGVGPMTNTVSTVEHFLNIPIDYYVKVNFNGFIDVVDAVGGVDVNVPFDFSVRLFNKMQYYEKGPAHLDGMRALGYVRMRKSDPRGDLGRNMRQREVIQAVMDEAVSIKSVTKIDDILKSVGNNVTHNMQIDQLLALQNIYRKIPKDHLETLKMNGENSNNNPRGIWYYIVSDQERLRLSNIIRKQLELPTQTLDGRPYDPPETQEPDPNTETAPDPSGTGTQDGSPAPGQAPADTTGSTTENGNE
ncbi:LytR family transcriptional attenuator [Melghirimyces profundicolus]|uniref:LytR family transcriptional attenuator n=1 Tax=Melghirimyces profundicolus TaxID=1242148 RepID=A0A2T6BGG4_9BACL|nr:LCP family protein [Melghirimyces profundicolus]PTX55131.1 LytR family transcriptional attenuator [Melghirimyces profundicolus]